MSEPFDPYHKWLGIRESQRPPNHYRLLGLEPFEDDADVIANAADRQMAYIRTYQLGSHAEQSQRMLNELAAAKVCLLDTIKKEEYDRSLRDHLHRPAIPHTTRGSLSLQQLPSRPRKSFEMSWSAVLPFIIVLLLLGTAIAVVWKLDMHPTGATTRPPSIADARDTRHPSSTSGPAPSTSPQVVQPDSDTKAPTSLADDSAFRGLLLATDFDCSGTAYRMDIATPIDVSQSWALTFDLFATSLDPGLHVLVIWGDERAGRDVIYVRLDGSRLEFVIQDSATNGGHGISLNLEPMVLNRWVPLSLRYEAASPLLEATVDGQVVGRERPSVAPLLDRPMPIWIGGASATEQRFLGRIRHLILKQTASAGSPGPSTGSGVRCVDTGCHHGVASETCGRGDCQARLPSTRGILNRRDEMRAHTRPQ